MDYEKALHIGPGSFKDIARDDVTEAIMYRRLDRHL